jgi:hypothetical protein
MMRRRRTSIAIGIAVSVLAALPATAAAAHVDQQSDHAVLSAYHSYLEGVIARIPAARKADTAYVSSVSRRCGGVLAPLSNASTSSVNQTALFDFGEELGGAAGVVAYGPARGQLPKMAATLKKLHWSSPQAANIVNRYLAAQRRLFGLAPGDVCGDAKSLVASHAETIPPGTKRWLAKFRGAAAAAQSTASAFRRLLDTFATPANNGLLAANNRLLHSYTGKLGDATSPNVTKLVSALGL